MSLEHVYTCFNQLYNDYSGATDQSAGAIPISYYLLHQKETLTYLDSYNHRIIECIKLEETLTSLAKFDSTCTSAFLVLSLHVHTAHSHSFQAIHSCFHHLYFSFFSLSLTSGTLLSHGGFLPPLLDFLSRGMGNSCALRKVSLKYCQRFSFLVPKQFPIS